MASSQESVESWYDLEKEKAFEEYTAKVKRYGNKPSIINQYKKRMGNLRQQFSVKMEQAIRSDVNAIRTEKLKKAKAKPVEKKKEEK